MENNDLIGEFEKEGHQWHFFSAEHMNPMWYRYMTTEEINRREGFDLDVGDDEPLGEDELGFFIANGDILKRPAVIIELVPNMDSGWTLQASKTNLSSPRAGMAGGLSDEYRVEVESVEEANKKLKEFARELDDV